ncbi:MAG TPA: hypothetical protein VF618_15630 [Thermoanaerobaculia bacterium]
MHCDATPRRSAAASAAAIFAVLTPKCPFCLIAVASTVGVQVTALGRWLLPATVVLLAVSLAFTGWASHVRRQWAAFVIAALGAATVMFGRLALDSTVTLAVGALLMIAAALWLGRTPRAES